MQTMRQSSGTYPNEYTRYYANQLLEGQGESGIDALAGATSSHGTFQVLAQAVVEQARKGDSSIVLVMCPIRNQNGICPIKSLYRQ